MHYLVHGRDDRPDTRVGIGSSGQFVTPRTTEGVLRQEVQEKRAAVRLLRTWVSQHQPQGPCALAAAVKITSNADPVIVAKYVSRAQRSGEKPTYLWVCILGGLGE